MKEKDLYKQARDRERYWILRKLQDDLFVIYLVGGDGPKITFYDLVHFKVVENPNYAPYSFKGWCDFINNDVFGNIDELYSCSAEEEQLLVLHFDDYAS